MTTQEKLNDKLINASESGDLTAVKSLIEQGADIHAHDNNALKMSVYAGNIKIFNY